MSAFERALAFTLRWEGGRSDHPDDRGGLTRYGISQRQFPELDIERLTLEDAKAIYRLNYWEEIHGEELPAEVALALFDYAVHSGVRRAARALQRSSGSRPDGVVGPKTLAAVSQRDARNLALEVVRRRAGFLVWVVRRDAAQLAFLGGWINRLLALAAEVASYRETES